MLSERVILVNSDDDESEDELYKGYNDFNPALDTRVSIFINNFFVSYHACIQEYSRG